MTSLYSASALFSQVGNFYTQNIAPKLTKDNIYDATAGSVSMAAYYYLGGSVGQINGPMFVKRASLSMGFTVFNTAVKPVVAQFVESFVEMQVNNVQYTYYSIRCITDVKYCDEITKITNTAVISENESLLQFDTTALVQKLNQDFSELTLDKLLLSGAVSAVASEVKNAVYVVTGFDQICQGSICKNWISYYVRDALKNEIKSVISDPIETEKTTQPLIAPIAMELAELSKVDIKEVPQEIFLTGTLNTHDISMGSSIQIHDVIDVSSSICPLVNQNMSETALQQQGIDATAAAWVQQFNTMNVLPAMMLAENVEP